MKKLILILGILIISCGPTRYLLREYDTSDPKSILDTLVSVNLPDTSIWLKQRFFNFQDSTLITSYSITYIEKRSRHIITLTKYSELDYNIKYRRE